MSSGRAVRCRKSMGTSRSSGLRGQKTKFFTPFKNTQSTGQKSGKQCWVSHVFWPRVSGSISQRYGSGSSLQILPFSHKGVERTEIMLEKLNFNTKFGKIKFLRLKLMCLQVSYKKKIWLFSYAGNSGNRGEGAWFLHYKARP